MKTNYFTKVENKYVFNISRIFWHVIIALITVAIIASLLVFLWSIIPASQQKVAKQTYPEIKTFPEPVKVTLAELKSTGERPKEVTPDEPVRSTTPPPVSPASETVEGKGEYDATLDSLKVLIPPSKYSWAGSGQWTYPYGERYWLAYRQEEFRSWVVTEPSIEQRLEASFQNANAQSFAEKSLLLKSYITTVNPLPENRRLGALKSLTNNVLESVSKTISTNNSIAELAAKMNQADNFNYFNQVSVFGKRNPNDGVPFINYAAKIINSFSENQRSTIIDRLINSYYNYFNQNLSKLEEATDLYLQILTELPEEEHGAMLMQYFRLYLTKNAERDRIVDQIVYDHQQLINEIDNQFEMAKFEAEQNFLEKKFAKQSLRSKSLIGIAAGVILIVLTATVLVFLSIQRSVRRIEEKISAQEA